MKSQSSRMGLLSGAAVVLAGLALAGAARAGVIDPLHGTCNGTSPSGSCIDNGINTELGNSTTFGFTISPGPQTGDLTVVALVPNNSSFDPGSLTETLPGSSTYNFASVVGTWNSGTLADFLGISASPNNPIGAYLPSTQYLDSAATAFNVFTANVGTLTISATGSGGSDPTFDMISGMPLGSYFVAFCAGSTAGGDCTSGGNSMTEVATMNSGALLVDGNTPVPTPEPGALALFAAGLLGCALFVRRRRASRQA